MIRFTETRSKMELYIIKKQRWSRGHKARGQGHKKTRGQDQGQGQPFRGQTLSRPRTGMLKAKTKDQGHSRKCSPKKQIFKKVFQAISNSYANPELLIGVGLNHKSHAMTSSKFFKKRSFCGASISLGGRSKIVTCWH